MAPINSVTQNRRIEAARSVLAICKFGLRVANRDSLSDISSIKGLFSRAYLQDQWDDLREAIASDPDELKEAIAGAEIVAQAAGSGNLFYLTSDALAGMSDIRFATEEFLWQRSNSMPIDKRGFALLAATESDDDNEKTPARFLAWEAEDGRISAILTNRQQLIGSITEMTKIVSSYERWVPGTNHERVDGPVRHVRLIHELVSVALETDHQPTPVNYEQNGGGSERKPPQGTVLVIDAPRDSNLNRLATLKIRQTPEYRWRVRSHWRRQWYPSLNKHQLIWIEEHTSGPMDMPVLSVRRVRVLS